MDNQNKLIESKLTECVVCDKVLNEDTKIIISSILGGTVFYYCHHCQSVYDTHDKLLVVSVKESNNVVGIA